MSGPAKSVLGHVRTFGQRFFRAFGIHCATHQIRVILISSVVITSLFYPAIALYSSSRIPSLRVLTSFTRSKDAHSPDWLADLADIWSTHDALRIREDRVSRVRCGVEPTVLVERILIETSSEYSTPLDRQTLLSTLQLEEYLDEAIHSRSLPCLKSKNGRCFVVSPLAFWKHDEGTVKADADILHTLTQKPNISISGVPVSAEMVLFGGTPTDDDGPRFSDPDYLVLTYFFLQPDCVGNSGHESWIAAVSQATTSHGAIRPQTAEPTILSLEYDVSTNRGQRAFSAFTAFAYFASFSFVTWRIRNLQSALHSCAGVVFTGAIELIVSTITSVSVCALVGFKVTLVPWELLTLTIAFIGAENMISLVEAVGRTSVSLPVKQRIGEGLSRAGTSNTLKLISYNAILGIIAVFSTGAIHQFCVFSTVVLVAHWFLSHTFFTTVLSIDLQRLELDDLLRQDAGPPVMTDKAPAPTKPAHSTSKLQKGWMALQGLLKGRAYRNLNLLLLLATTGLIYYTTYPSSTSSPSSAHTTAENISASRTWEMLNPHRDALLHLRIESPFILTLQANSSDEHAGARSRPHPSFWNLKMGIRFIKIVVVPIAATTTALYGLLLYLLKDAELLEAQRHAEPETKPSEAEQTLDEKVTFSTLPRTFATDVKLIAASKDGAIVASTGVQHELTVWKTDSGTDISVDVAQILERIPCGSSGPPSVTALAVDDTGRYLAAGTGTGLVIVWTIQDHALLQLRQLSPEKSTSAVVDLEFVPSRFQPPVAGNGGSGYLLVVHEDGTVVKWAVASAVPPEQLVPSRPASVVKSTLIRLAGGQGFLLAFHTDDGMVEVVDIFDTGAEHLVASECHLQAGNPQDLVTHIHAFTGVLEGDRRTVFAAATEAGVVSVWDGHTAECMNILEDRYPDVSSLRVSSISSDACQACGELPLESFFVAFSVEYTIRIFKMCLPSAHRRCSCIRNELHHMSSHESFGHSSRRNSVSSVSSVRSRSRVPSLSDDAPFLVSAHGVHSRRASEKDSSRRLSDVLTVPQVTEELESPIHPVGPLEHVLLFPSHNAWWRNLYVRRQLDATCERGRWDVANRKIVGIRRRSRSDGPKSTPSVHATLHGLAPATLERWELWILDPSVSRTDRSVLVSLWHEKESQPTRVVPRLPFTRVSPLVACPSHLLAGFGNSIGYFVFLPR